MKHLNSIGLDEKKSKQLAASLNDLLANYSIFYQNLRGYHWNIKGNKFFELHLKFEELYNDLVLKIDEIAERILTLGFAPNHKYSDYRKMSTITEKSEVSDGTKAVKDILDSFKMEGITEYTHEDLMKRILRYEKEKNTRDRCWFFGIIDCHFFS